MRIETIHLKDAFVKTVVPFWSARKTNFIPVGVRKMKRNARRDQAITLYFIRMYTCFDKEAQSKFETYANLHSNLK